MWDILNLWNQLKGRVDERIKEKTVNCVRMHRYDVVSAAANGYVEVRIPFGAAVVKALELQCAPMYHLSENGNITMQRSNEAEPERHIIQSFTRPLSGGAMTISTLSAGDFPEATQITE